RGLGGGRLRGESGRHHRAHSRRIISAAHSPPAMPRYAGDVFVSTDFGVNMLRSGRGASKLDLNEMSSDPAAGFGGTVSMGRKRYPSFSLLIPYCSSFL